MAKLADIETRSLGVGATPEQIAGFFSQSHRLTGPDGGKLTTDSPHGSAVTRAPVGAGCHGESHRTNLPDPKYLGVIKSDFADGGQWGNDGS